MPSRTLAQRHYFQFMEEITRFAVSNIPARPTVVELCDQGNVILAYFKKLNTCANIVDPVS